VMSKAFSAVLPRTGRRSWPVPTQCRPGVRTTRPRPCEQSCPWLPERCPHHGKTESRAACRGLRIGERTSRFQSGRLPEDVPMDCGTGQSRHRSFDASS
jgi:hypothetical protein